MPISTAGAFEAPYSQDDIEASSSSVVHATVSEAFNSLVGPSLFRIGQLDTMRKYGGIASRDYSPTEARDYMSRYGLADKFQFDRSYNGVELDELARRKQAELKRQYILSRADPSASSKAGRMGLGIASSFLDPLTVASAFVPVVGEARYAELVAGASGALGRAGVRAGIGAAEGAAGSALVEPVIYGAHRQEQADYDLADSMLNIGVGTVFGGGLHVIGGAIGDALRTAPTTRTTTADARLPGETDKAFLKRAIDSRPAPDLASMSKAGDDYVAATSTSVGVRVDRLVSSKPEEIVAQSGDKALKRFQAAAAGEISKRPPIDVELGADGRLRVADGNGTLGAMRRIGVPEVQAEVRLSPELLEQIRTSEAPERTRQGLMDQYQAAARAMPVYDRLVREAAIDAGAVRDPVIPPIKSVARTVQKTLADYGGDARQVKDLVRGTVLVDDFEQLDRTVKALQARLGAPTKHRNTLSETIATSDGYRDVNMNFNLRGHTVEVQVNFPEMAQTKESLHALYEERRGLQGASERTAAEDARIAELDGQMSERYAAAWKAALSRLKSASEHSRPSSRAQLSDTGRPSGTSKASVLEPPPGLGKQATGTPPASQKIGSLPMTGADMGAPPGDILPQAGNTRVFTSTGRQVEVRPRLVEASAVLTSDQDGYPVGLQPRLRGDRAASDAQVAEMARGLQPELLGLTPTADTGAPIIGPDGAVESGNGRVMALRKAYAEDGPAAARYRAWLDGQGYATAGLREPVLVRERVTAMSEPERQAFALEANKPGVMAMSPVERAQADAGALDDALLERLVPGAELTSRANHGFVAGFIQRLASSERNALVDAEGRLGQEGVRRIQGALLAKAYGGQGDATLAVLSRMFESTDADARSVLGALLDAAPSFARLREAVSAGHVDPSYDISRQVATAAEELARIRARGQAIGEALKQTDMLEARDPVVDTLLRTFHNDGLTRLAGRERIAGTLSKYADDAGEQLVDQAKLFGDAPPSPEVLLGAARAANPEGKAKSQADLFGPSAAGRVAGADPRVREAALRASVAQAVSGEPIEVRPIFGDGDLRAAHDRLADPDQAELADPAAVLRADEVLEQGDPSEAQALEKEITELQAELTAMKDDAELDGSTDLAEQMKADDVELKELEKDSREAVRRANLLTMCARKSAE